MRSLGKYIRNRKDIQLRLNNCTCEQHANIPTDNTWQRQLCLHVEDFVETTCCTKVPHPHLVYGFGSTRRIPKLFNWDCINDKCNECGVEKN